MPRQTIALRVTERIMSDRVARQHLAVDESRALFEEALAQLEKYKAWSSTFPATLRGARLSSRKDLDGDFVWQDDFIDFWEPFTSIQRELLALYDDVMDANPETASRIESYLDPPTKAQIEFATEVTEFLERPGFKRNQIAYDVRRLEIWHKHFSAWLDIALEGLRKAIPNL
jgi:hypothetical protein